jgi:hypothetical protein
MPDKPEYSASEPTLDTEQRGGDLVSGIGWYTVVTMDGVDLTDDELRIAAEAVLRLRHPEPTRPADLADELAEALRKRLGRVHVWGPYSAPGEERRDWVIWLRATLARHDARKAESGWRPIKSAPKDGTEVLALLPDGTRTIAAWMTPTEMHGTGALGPDPWDEPYDDSPRWWEHFGAEMEVEPTHWQPLPPPPEPDHAD